MSIIQCAPIVFRARLIAGNMNFLSHSFKIALYTSAASLDQTTLTYTTNGEVVSPGYTAGGAPAIASTVAVGTSNIYVNFSDVTWSDPALDITAAGAMIYSTTNIDLPPVVILSFGPPVRKTGTFTVKFPASTQETALIRI